MRFGRDFRLAFTTRILTADSDLGELDPKSESLVDEFKAETGAQVEYLSQDRMDAKAVESGYKRLVSGHYELTDGRMVYLADWLVREAEDAEANRLRALLLPMILDHVRARIELKDPAKHPILSQYPSLHTPIIYILKLPGIRAISRLLKGSELPTRSGAFRSQKSFRAYHPIRLRKLNS